MFFTWVPGFCPASLVASQSPLWVLFFPLLGHHRTQLGPIPFAINTHRVSQLSVTSMTWWFLKFTSLPWTSTLPSTLISPHLLHTSIHLNVKNKSETQHLKKPKSWLSPFQIMVIPSSQLLRTKILSPLSFLRPNSTGHRFLPILSSKYMQKLTTSQYFYCCWSKPSSSLIRIVVVASYLVIPPFSLFSFQHGSKWFKNRSQFISPLYSIPSKSSHFFQNRIQSSGWPGYFFGFISY